MSKRELIVEQLSRLSEADLDRLLAFLRSLTEERAESSIPVVAAVSALAKDWLSPEEDAPWASF